MSVISEAVANGLFLVLVHVLVLVLEIPAREDWVTAFFLRVVGR
jgi:hypothetical protein